jgi:chromosome segregation ATPase
VAILSPDPLVAAVVRLDDKRRELGSQLVAAEGANTALSTELDAQRARVTELEDQLVASQASESDLAAKLSSCRATRQWLNDRVAQLEAAWPTGSTPPPAPTPKP